MSDEKDKIKITTPEYSGEEFAPDAVSEPAAPVEEIKKAEKILTDNDEIAAFNKEVLGELDPPLVVHKKSDASYDNNNNSVLEMNDTHIDDTKPTLTRHRFKKENKKKGKGAVVVIFIAVVIVAVFAGLYFTGNISLSGNKGNTQSSSQTSETTTTLQQKYAGTIVVKGMYIFVDGTEVDGIQGLTESLKYLDKSTTAYEIIIEGTQNSYESSYYNSDILGCLTQLGFYGDDTKVEHVDSTGLMSKEEIEKSSVQASSEQAAQSQSQTQTQSQQQTQNAQ